MARGESAKPSTNLLYGQRRARPDSDRSIRARLQAGEQIELAELSAREEQELVQAAHDLWHSTRADARKVQIEALVAKLLEQRFDTARQAELERNLIELELPKLVDACDSDQVARGAITYHERHPWSSDPPLTKKALEFLADSQGQGMADWIDSLPLPLTPSEDYREYKATRLLREKLSLDQMTSEIEESYARLVESSFSQAEHVLAEAREPYGVKPAELRETISALTADPPADAELELEQGLEPLQQIYRVVGREIRLAVLDQRQGHQGPLPAINAAPTRVAEFFRFIARDLRPGWDHFAVFKHGSRRKRFERRFSDEPLPEQVGAPAQLERDVEVDLFVAHLARAAGISERAAAQAFADAHRWHNVLVERCRNYASEHRLRITAERLLEQVQAAWVASGGGTVTVG